jgi:hypothetical protein
MASAFIQLTLGGGKTQIATFITVASVVSLNEALTINHSTCTACPHLVRVAWSRLSVTCH